MKVVSMLIPEALVPYIEIQKSWVEQKQTGAVEMNFFQGGVTNMNLKSSVKLTIRTTVSTPSRAEVEFERSRVSG